MQYFLKPINLLILAFTFLAFSIFLSSQALALEIGTISGPGEAVTDASRDIFDIRYQYLSAGVNTGAGWATWNANGDFATFYIEDSIENNIVPAFSYYNIYQSSPGNSQDESTGVQTNLQNSSTMNAYFTDLALFFEKAAAFPNQEIILHVEPDMWGYIQQGSSGNDGSNYYVAVADSGYAAVSGFPNNGVGLAQAIVSLKNSIAPNVKLGYHISIWGTGTDFTYGTYTNSQIVGFGDTSAEFYNSLGANFDILFSEIRDRDAGFYQEVYGNPDAAWDNTDYDNFRIYLNQINNQTNKPIYIWQIPMGDSTRDNTPGNYVDNAVEYFFEASPYENAAAYEAAGVEALLFGGGASNTSGPTNFTYNLFSHYKSGNQSTCTPPFPDVNCSNIFIEYIRELKTRNITQGKSDGNYGPRENVTRAQFSSFVVRAFSITSSGNPTSPFTDSLPSNHQNDILTLYSRGIISGYSDNTFRADNPITRAESTKMIDKALELTLGEGNYDALTNGLSQANFPDVANSNVFFEFITNISGLEIMNGYSSGNFGPNDNLSREQMAKVVVGALDVVEEN